MLVLIILSRNNDDFEPQDFFEFYETEKRLLLIMTINGNDCKDSINVRCRTID